MADSMFVGGGNDDDDVSVPGSPEPETMNRDELLSSKTTMQERKKRPRPRDVDGTIAEDDERERKLSRASRWQIFLYHRHLPAVEADTIKSVYGDIEPTSHEYINARQRLVDDQKNFKAHLLADMAKLLEKHAEQPENKVLLDLDVEPSPARLRALAHSAWSPENFFQVWKYIKGYVDYEKSTPLGQYYMKHMFQGLALEVAKWLRVKGNEAEGLARRQEVHNFYRAMPKKAEFSAVSKDCFYEVFEHQRNQKRQKKDDEAAIAAAHERFEIDEPPPPPPSRSE
ncbi:hypothetical protein F4679DRAFT_583466 [Xylaria curta]|nr:hypothetical protein F4679DRAFT_583466 [Xylaria curta]